MVDRCETKCCVLLRRCIKGVRWKCARSVVRCCLLMTRHSALTTTSRASSMSDMPASEPILPSDRRNEKRLTSVVTNCSRMSGSVYEIVHSIARIDQMCNFVPHRLHAVRKMRPITTDVAHSVVCVSVCALGAWASCTKKCLKRSRCHLGG